MEDLQSEKTFKDLLNFPTAFSFKVVAMDTVDMESAITAVIEQQFKLKIQEPITKKLSKKATYASYTVTAVVESEVQINQIYQALGSIQKVKLVL